MLFKNVKVRSIFILLFLLPLYLFGSSIRSLADPLPPSEIQALNEYPDWIGTSDCTDSSSVSDVTLTGSDNAQKVWNFFLSDAGLTPTQAAGVMGNLFAQDGVFDPEEVQYPPGGDSPTPTTQKDLGWGLAQWTPTSGANPIIAAAQIAGVPSDQLNTLAGQLTIILSEMKTGSPPGVTDMIKILKQQTTVETATQVFWQDFEGGGPDVPPKVIGFAEKMLADYGGSGNGSQTTTTTDNGSGCTTDAPLVNCTPSSQADSTLSPLRQDVICLAKQQEAIWASEPVTYRSTGYYVYSEGRPELWCADFVSWIYKNAGDPFTSGNNGWNISGVAGITSVPGFTYHPSGGKPYTPVPGDIGIFSIGGQSYAHTAIYLGTSAGTSVWIGGDQGPSPNGVFPINGVPDDSESQVDYGYNEPGPGGYIMGYVSPNGS